MKRVIAPLSLLLLVALAGCASAPTTGTSSASPAATAVASPSSETATQSATDTTPPSEAPQSAPPVAGGTATDFCGAFKEIQAITEAPTGDPATVGAQFQAAAADMRKYAPAEIATAANTYANLMDNIGKAAAGGTFDEAALSKAISDGLAGNAKDIGTTAIWVAKNCNL